MKKTDEQMLFDNDTDEVAHCWDMPIKVYHNSMETPTTFRDQMSGKKCALVVNVASQCGHTGKHYTQMVELHEKYSKKGFQVMAFPSH